MPDRHLSTQKPKRPAGSRFRWRVYRDYLYRALGQDASPRYLALSFATGVFCSVLPLPGHSLIVTIIALVFRLNLLALMAGAWVNLPIFYPLSYGSAFLIGGFLMNVEIVPIEWSRVSDLSYSWLLLKGYFLPLFVGTTIVGGVASVPAYFVARHTARKLHGVFRGPDVEPLGVGPIADDRVIERKSA